MTEHQGPTPEAVDTAIAKLQAELTANAAKIAEVLDGESRPKTRVASARVFLYETHPTTHTTHLRVPEATTTLCGRTVTADWDLGDETVSGLLAGCERCKSTLARLA